MVTFGKDASNSACPVDSVGWMVAVYCVIPACKNDDNIIQPQMHFQHQVFRNMTLCTVNKEPQDPPMMFKKAGSDVTLPSLAVAVQW